MDNGALLAMVAHGNPEELQSALEGQTNLDVRDGHGRNILDLAALLGRSAVLRILVERGVSVNGYNRSGYGALHWSAMWGRLACLKELVALGAPHDTKTRHGETAKDLAVRYNHTDCAEFMDRVNARATLRAAVIGMRDILGDNEKVQGKWNKDDKVTAGCNEKLEWLDRTPDATLVEIEEQRHEFCQRMEPHLAKLSSNGDKISPL